MRVLIVSLAIAFVVLTPFVANADSDWRNWNTVTTKGKISDNVGAAAELEFRFRDNASEFYYQHSQIALSLKCPKMDWLTITPAFREVYELDKVEGSNSLWFAEHRSLVNVAASCKLGDWKIKNRARVSYRDFDIDKGSTFRGRHKLTIQTPWKLAGMKPYISDEIFVEQGKAGIYRNRLAGGVSFKLLERVKGGVYYLLQTTDGKDDIHVAGTKLKAEF